MVGGARPQGHASDGGRCRRGAVDARGLAYLTGIGPSGHRREGPASWPGWPFCLARPAAGPGDRARACGGCRGDGGDAASAPGITVCMILNLAGSGGCRCLRRTPRTSGCGRGEGLAPGRQGDGQTLCENQDDIALPPAVASPCRRSGARNAQPAPRTMAGKPCRGHAAPPWKSQRHRSAVRTGGRRPQRGGHPTRGAGRTPYGAAA